MNDIEQHEKRKECRHFDECSAQFCPMAMNIHATWLSQDEICKSHEFKDNIIIRNQRKIGRRSGDTSRYFNYEMLNQEFIIRKGILGIDPDVPESYGENQSLKLYIEREKSWLKKHRPMTDERKAQLRSIGKQMVLDMGDRQ
jgi:hypothetical protein